MSTADRPAAPSSPHRSAIDGDRRSASTSSTRPPFSAITSARLTDVVDLPSPGRDDVTTNARSGSRGVEELQVGAQSSVGLRQRRCAGCAPGSAASGTGPRRAGSGPGRCGSAGCGRSLTAAHARVELRSQQREHHAERQADREPGRGRQPRTRRVRRSGPCGRRDLGHLERGCPAAGVGDSSSTAMPSWCATAFAMSAARAGLAFEAADVDEVAVERDVASGASVPATCR